MTKPAPISTPMPKVWPERVFVAWSSHKLPVPYALDKLPDWMRVMVVLQGTGRNRNFETMFSLS